MVEWDQFHRLGGKPRTESACVHHDTVQRMDAVRMLMPCWRLNSPWANAVLHHRSRVVVGDGSVASELGQTIRWTAWHPAPDMPGIGEPTDWDSDNV